MFTKILCFALVAVVHVQASPETKTAGKNEPAAVPAKPFGNIFKNAFHPAGDKDKAASDANKGRSSLAKNVLSGFFPKPGNEDATNRNERAASSPAKSLGDLLNIFKPAGDKDAGEANKDSSDANKGSDDLGKGLLGGLFNKTGKGILSGILEKSDDDSFAKRALNAFLGVGKATGDVVHLLDGLDVKS